MAKTRLRQERTKRRQIQPHSAMDFSLSRTQVWSIAILSRLFVFVLQYNMLMAHDDIWYLKVAKINHPATNLHDYNQAPKREKKFLDMFGAYASTDGKHLLSIATQGYFEEHLFAFFPMLPILIRIGAELFGFILSLVPFFGLTCSLVSRVLLSCVLLQTVLFCEIAYYFVTFGNMFRSKPNKLQKRHTYELILVVLFCFNPAAAFFSCCYSENLFLYCNLRFHIAHQLGEKSKFIWLFVASATRSNGFLNAFFLLWDNAELWGAVKKRHVLMFFVHSLRTAPGLIIAILPTIIFQYYAYYVSCLVDVGKPIVDTSFNMVIQSSYIGLELCELNLPLSYSFVQKKYWDVGSPFPKYHQNVCDYNIGFPVFLISIWAIIYWGGLSTIATSNLSSRVLSVCRLQRPGQLYHLMALTFISAVFMFPMCATRFILSASPFLMCYIHSLFDDVHELQFEYILQSIVTTPLAVLHRLFIKQLPYVYNFCFHSKYYVIVSVICIWIISKLSGISFKKVFVLSFCTMNVMMGTTVLASNSAGWL